MYVAVALDSGSHDRARELADLLAQYGFKMVQRGLWESATISPDTLNRIKRDVDKATDGYDRLRFFQFPMEGTLVLSSLREKKWRRMVAKGAGNAAEAEEQRQAQGWGFQAAQKPAKRK